MYVFRINRQSQEEMDTTFTYHARVFSATGIWLQERSGRLPKKKK